MQANRERRPGSYPDPSLPPDDGIQHPGLADAGEAHGHRPANHFDVPGRKTRMSGFRTNRRNVIRTAVAGGTASAIAHSTNVSGLASPSQPAAIYTRGQDGATE